MSLTGKEDRIISIMRDELIKEMDIGFDHVDEMLEKTRKNGILGTIMHSIEKFIFSYFARDSVRDKTIRQMEIIFDGAKRYKNGTDMSAIGKDYFKEYLHNDETYHRCNKHHPKFRVITDNIKEGFESRIKQTAKMLEKGSGNTYGDLVKSTFNHKDEAIEFLSRELKCVKNEIDILIKYPDILKVPVAKKRILEIIIGGYEYAKKRLMDNLDRFYDDMN
ncbi:MAG: hypothetical protein ACTSVI_04035 [Promethearchaeota archaeon]